MTVVNCYIQFLCSIVQVFAARKYISLASLMAAEIFLCRTLASEDGKTA